MQAKERIHQIHKRQLRRKKKVSLNQLTVAEEALKKRKEDEAKSADWSNVDKHSLRETEREHSIHFESLISHLQKRHGQKLRILIESVGRSSLKQELLGQEYGKGLDITTTDLRRGNGWPDQLVNALDLVKRFGKGKFHCVISPYGGVKYSGLPEKAIFQVVSVLTEGGIGIVSLPASKTYTLSELRALAKRMNIQIKLWDGGKSQLTFVKNYGKEKKGWF